jgi:hypothetical protein
MSATPPGGKGTTSEMGFDGYTSCAAAVVTTSIEQDRQPAIRRPGKSHGFVRSILQEADSSLRVGMRPVKR